MKVPLGEIKKNLQENNRAGKEDKIQTDDLEHKEEISIQPVQKEETKIFKKEERLRNLWDISKHAKIWIIGMSEGEEEEHEKWKLTWKNNERKLP